MNAIELADNLEEWVSPRTVEQAATMLRQQAEEIERLKEQLEDCICQGGHSEAYLKVKGKK